MENIKLGTTIKKIREDKGISQNYIARNIISQSNYSRFENGYVDVSAETFLRILERLELDLKEFNILHQHNKVDTRKNIINNFYKLTYNSFYDLTDLLNKIENYHIESEDLYIQHIKKICESLLIFTKTNNLKEAQIGLNEVWEILCKRNQLYIADIYLMNSILFYFPLQTIPTIKNLLIQSIDYYKGDKDLETIKLNILINYSLLLLKYEKYPESMENIDVCINLSKELGEYLRLGISYIRKGIIASHIINPKNDSTYWIDRGLDILFSIEEDNIINILKEEIEIYINKS